MPSVDLAQKDRVHRAPHEARASARVIGLDLQVQRVEAGTFFPEASRIDLVIAEHKGDRT